MTLKNPSESAGWALGLMSGTSLDGMDAALIYSDGERVTRRGHWLSIPYDAAFRAELRELTHGRGDEVAIEHRFTERNAELVHALLSKAGLSAREVQVIGFHGQTVRHAPDQGITRQIGNGALLAELTGIDVVCDFRRRDVAAGGQGAPLVPLYHAALARDVRLPVVVLNLGGIANVTWIGCSEGPNCSLIEHDILAFDTGPGNVLLNEWTFAHTGQPMDENGALARQGKVDAARLAALLAHPYFAHTPPKSLDRNAFDVSALTGLSAADGAATLAAFTAHAAARAAEHFPVAPSCWYVTGGGRHNPAIMQALRGLVGEVQPVEMLGWEGDALEAEAFAFLALRSLRGLPLSLPTTTGARRAVTGGAVYRV